MGNNIDLGEGRVLLEPRTFAKMLDALEVGDRDLVLDIGCGTGYSAAVLAQIAQGVVAVEENASLAADAQTALSATGCDTVVLHTGPLVAGAPDYAPYDAMILQGGAEQFPRHTGPATARRGPGCLPVSSRARWVLSGSA